MRHILFTSLFYLLGFFSTPYAFAATITIDKQQATITHAKGVTTLTLNPQKIVVFDFGTMDTLITLHHDVAGYPKKSIPTYLQTHQTPQHIDAGSMKKPDFTLLKQAKPDLIVITGRQGEQYEALSAIAPTIDMSIDATQYLDSFQQNAYLWGQLLDQATQTEAQLDQLMKKINSTQHKIKQQSKQSALVLIHNEGKFIVAHSSANASIIHDVAGFAKADAQISKERKIVDADYLARINPDYIFVIDRSAAIGQAAMQASQLTQLAKTATIQPHIVTLSPDLWYLSGGGIQSLALQLDEINSALQ